MKGILSIFKRDMKAIIKNPVAFLIITGLCIIPSLYAWVNIAASWDVYENTGTIPIAVVNNDKGTKLLSQDINMGDEVISELKKNKSIGWEFVDSKQADIGVIDGKYYAAIEIPEDFSKDLASLTTDDPVKPNIVYKVDTKANPVAGKITNAAQEKLIDNIKSNFVSTVNKTVFSSLNELGDKVEKNKQKILELKNGILTMNKNMDLVLNALQSTNNNANNLNTYLNGIKDTIPQITSGIDQIQDSNEESKKLATYTKNTMNNSFDSLNINLDQINSSQKRMSTLLENLNKSVSSGNSKQVSTAISIMKQEITYMNGSIDNVLKFLEGLNKKVTLTINGESNTQIINMITLLNDLKSSLNSESDKLNDLEKSYQSTKDLNSDILRQLNQMNSSISDEVSSSMSQYNNNTKQALTKIYNNYIKSTEDANELLGDSKEMVENVNKFIESAMQGTKVTVDVSSDLKEQLESFESGIGKLSDKLEKVNDNDLTQILTILQSNPDVMGGYISQPFNIKDESIYKVANYGSGMAPIYSVLATWVGALMLTSLLTTKVAEFEGSENLTVRQKYLGKLLSFLTYALIQALILTIGDKYIIGVQTVNTPLFILFGVLCSLTFCTIVFTLVSLFGNVGKGIAIILMVIQIAGSGGSYPIQVDPKFFRVLQPFFPFTYGLEGFREAIAGPLASKVLLDIGVLVSIIVVTLLIGILFKQKLSKQVEKFDEKFEKSGIAE